MQGSMILCDDDMRSVEAVTVVENEEIRWDVGCRVRHMKVKEVLPINKSLISKNLIQTFGSYLAHF